MSELVLNTNTLPEPLVRLFHVEKVRVRESGGVVSLIPVTEGDLYCPLRGLAADSNLTVEKFLAMTHDEKEIGL